MIALRTPPHCHIGHILCAGCFRSLVHSLAHRHEYNEVAVANLSNAYLCGILGADYLTATATILQHEAIKECREFQRGAFAEPAHEDRISFEDDEPLIGWERGNFVACVLRVRDRIMGRAA